MSRSVAEYEEKRGRAQEARREAESLRKLHRVATCGLDMRYGTQTAPHHIALRVANQYLVWAGEYDVIAGVIEADMAAMFAPVAAEDPPALDRYGYTGGHLPNE